MVPAMIPVVYHLFLKKLALWGYTFGQNTFVVYSKAIIRIHVPVVQPLWGYFLASILLSGTHWLAMPQILGSSNNSGHKLLSLLYTHVVTVTSMSPLTCIQLLSFITSMEECKIIESEGYLISGVYKCALDKQLPNRFAVCWTSSLWHRL